MNKLKIIIADDNKQVAEFSKSFLDRVGKYDILGMAFTSKEEIELIQKYSPDIVITDIVRKGEDVSGLDIILKCEKEKKKVHIGDTSNLSNKMLYVQSIIEKEKDKEGDIFVNGDLNNGFNPYFREKV